MSKRSEMKKMKTKNCTSSASNDTSACGNRPEKSTKACGGTKKCK